MQQTVFWESHKIEPGKKAEYRYFSEIADMPDFADAVFPFTLAPDNPNYKTPLECISLSCALDTNYRNVLSIMSNSSLSLFAYNEGDDRKSLAPLLVSPLYRFPAAGWSVTAKERPVFCPVQTKPRYKFFYIIICFPSPVSISKPVGLTISVDAILAGAQRKARRQ